MSAVASTQSKGGKSSIVDYTAFNFENLLVRPPRVVNGKAGQRTYVSFAMKNTNLPLFMKFESWCGLGFTDPYIKTAPGVAATEKQIKEAISKASSYSYELSVPENILPELQAWDKYIPEYVFENRQILLAGSSILEEEDETIMKKMIARAYKPIIRYSKKDTEKKYPKIAICFRRMNFERHTGQMAYTQDDVKKNMVLEIFENGKPKKINSYQEMKEFVKPKSKVSQLITFDFWRLNDQYGIKVMTNNINALRRSGGYEAPSGNVWDTDGSVSQTDAYSSNVESDPYASNPDEEYETKDASAEEDGSASVEDSEENLEAEIEADASEEEAEQSAEPEEEEEPEEEPEPVKTVKKTTVRRAAPKKAAAKTK